VLLYGDLGAYSLIPKVVDKAFLLLRDGELF